MAEQQFIVFSMADEQYGVPVGQIQSIERVLPITRVPKTLKFIKGVMNLRGIVTPVLDLRERFGFPVVETTDETRIIVVSVEEMTVGLVVDKVLDVQPLSDAMIAPPPTMVGGMQATYLNGVAKIKDKVLILVNLNRVLSEVEEKQLKEVEKSVKG